MNGFIHEALFMKDFVHERFLCIMGYVHEWLCLIRLKGFYV